MKNAVIAYIGSESSMVSVEYDKQALSIRPGSKISVKVIVNAELKEPVNTNLVLQFKNGFSMTYPIRFFGMSNPYLIDPTLVDIPRSDVNVAGLILRNLRDVSLSDLYIDNGCKRCSTCNNKCNKPKIACKFIEKKIRCEFKDNGADMVDFVIHFVVKDLKTNDKKHFAVPAYVFINDNSVGLYPPILDFGILFANSDFSHKLHIRAKVSNRGDIVRVGYPYVEANDYLEYDFADLVHNSGSVTLEDNTYLVGTVTLKTQNLKEGNYSGHILFQCKEKDCKGDGKSRLPYKFTIVDDPLQAKSKKHSFEIPKKFNKKGKRKSFQIQMLALKNTFDHSLRINDITTHDKELSLSFINFSKLDEIDESQYCCLSSFPEASSTCPGCGSIIENSNSKMHNFLLAPDSENEEIKIRYRYHLNKSKTIEVKHVIVWAMGTYIPIPVYIYDKTLLCVFSYYSDIDGKDAREDINESPCNALSDFRVMDFGSVAEGYNHKRYLTMINKNPLAIFMGKIRVGQPTCNQEIINSKLKLIPMQIIDMMSEKVIWDSTNEEKVFDQIYDAEEGRDMNSEDNSIMDSTDFMIPPNSIVVFTVHLDNPILSDDSYCNRFESSLYFSNYQSPDFEIPISFEVLKGNITLYPNDLVEFPPSIPGIVQTKEIKALSSLRKKIYIKSVTSTNPNIVSARVIEDSLDSRVNMSVIEISTISAEQTDSFLKMKNIAIFHHLSNRMSRMQQVINGFKQDSDPRITFLDILAWQVNEKDWEHKKATNAMETTSVVKIETNVIQNLTIPVHTSVIKPTLLKIDTYDFGKIEVDTEKQGKVTVYNPSPNPMEVSFFIAPANFLKNIMEDLLSDDKLIKWKQICDKSTYFNPAGRKMCEGLLDMHSLDGDRDGAVIDIQDHVLSSFISDQQLFLQKTVEDITDSTHAIKPMIMKEISSQEDAMNNYYSVISKVFSIWPKKDHQLGEGHDDLVESIKVRFNQVLEETSHNMKDEFKSLFNMKNQNFFINNNAQCKSSEFNEFSQESNTFEPEECNSQ